MPVDYCPFCGLPFAERPGEGRPDKCAFDCKDWQAVFTGQDKTARLKKLLQQRENTDRED